MVDSASLKEHYMRLALQLAEKARGKTVPNPMVGAVVVNHGEIVGTGYHRQAGTPHAETLALDDAKEKARGAALYVNLEPCNHYGKTPPCTDYIIASGIAAVFVGMTDPNPLVFGKGIQKLREAGIEVEVGILQEECEKLNKDFIEYITKPCLQDTKPCLQES